MRHCIIILFIIAFCECLQSQITPTISEITSSNVNRTILDKYLKNYKVFSINKQEILDSLSYRGKCQFRLNIDSENDWVINIQSNDMRSVNFVALHTSDTGTFQYSGYTPNTFKGRTSDNKIVRFTIDENEFFGIILNGKEHIIIRKTRDYTNNEQDESLILYKASDLLVQNNDFDMINDAIVVPMANNAPQNAISNSSSPCTYYLELATDADFEFYQSMGNNLTNTYKYIFSILNLIEGVYESTFNLRFIVTFQNVWTTSNNPYTTTLAEALLLQFLTEWDNNQTGVARDIAHLFTGKDLDGDVVGIACMGQIGTNSAASLSMFRTEMFETTAHELGHNLNADHPTASNCLCGTSNASVMCQGQKDNNLWFCPFSINEISPFLAYNSSKLTRTFPDSLTLSGTITGFHEYQAKETLISTQTINSGFTVYKANEVQLNAGFEVQDTEFEIKIDNGDCE